MRWMDNYLIDGNKTMPDYELDHKAKLKAKTAEAKKAQGSEESEGSDSDK